MSDAAPCPRMEFTVVRGDIAEASADALVNAAGTSLRMGSGVAGALRRGANDPINEAAMPHYGDGRATAESIRDATRNALEAADERGCESLVIPALGCGVAGFDLADGAGIIAETMAAYDPETLRDVRFIAYSPEEYETVSRVADGDQFDPPESVPPLRSRPDPSGPSGRARRRYSPYRSVGSNGAGAPFPAGPSQRGHRSPRVYTGRSWAVSQFAQTRMSERIGGENRARYSSSSRRSRWNDPTPPAVSIDSRARSAAASSCASAVL